MGSLSVSCKENVCFCQNGKNDENYCPVNGFENCESCDRFYHLETEMRTDSETGDEFEVKICKPNQCFCEFGEGWYRDNCEVHGDLLCIR